ncbi:MAG: hypothetical protein P4M11_01325 [Candidatus Pacebacteria bacterium]|nr:hypothetical protein [Candidatus Paceibacterota bacterium]
MTVPNQADESNLLDIDSEHETGKHLPKPLLVVTVLILASAACFSLGVLAAGSLGNHADSEAPGSSLSVGQGSATSSQVIGDSSIHTYYLPWCTQSASIQAADMVWFPSVQAAQAKGYTAGKDCPGL